MNFDFNPPNRFFSPKHIPGVGTFQDLGLLENDPTVSALSEVNSLFVKEPDIVVSIGTGESKQNVVDLSNESDHAKKSVLRRLTEFIVVKWQDRIIRDAIKTRPDSQWYHRLNIQLSGKESRLDDAKCIPELKARAQEDDSISQDIDKIARRIIASRFYFELDSNPEKHDGRYMISGRILCTIRCKDEAFSGLINQLSAVSAQLFLNDRPVSAIQDLSCYGRDGNFCKLIQFSTEGKFTISLMQGELCNISGSPFSTERLIKEQQLDAPFGTPDHRKRKCTAKCEYPRKRQRCY
jgi:hypothetical protein